MEEYGKGLSRLSTIMKVLGWIAIVGGVFCFLSSFTNGAEWVGAAFGSLFGGAGLLFMGYVGEAINDIRDNTSVRNESEEVEDTEE